MFQESWTHIPRTRATRPPRAGDTTTTTREEEEAYTDADIEKTDLKQEFKSEDWLQEQLIEEAVETVEALETTETLEIVETAETLETAEILDNVDNMEDLNTLCNDEQASEVLRRGQEENSEAESGNILLVDYYAASGELRGGGERNQLEENAPVEDPAGGTGHQLENTARAEEKQEPAPVPVLSPTARGKRRGSAEANRSGRPARKSGKSEADSLTQSRSGRKKKDGGPASSQKKVRKSRKRKRSETQQETTKQKKKED